MRVSLPESRSSSLALMAYSEYSIGRRGMQAAMLMLTDRAVGTYAERIAAHYDIHRGGVADLNTLVASLGGEIAIATDSTTLAISPDGTFTIYVPVSTTVDRDRLLIAHSLGNLFLHHIVPRHLRTGTPRTTFYERVAELHGGAQAQARLFGCRLLVPLYAARTLYYLSKGDPYLVAKQYGVPFTIVTALIHNRYPRTGVQGATFEVDVDSLPLVLQARVHR